MTMGKQDYSTTSDFNIRNNNIVKTEKLKLLGVTINRCLNFSEHISAISKKGSKQIGVVMRLRKLIPEEAKLQFYKAAILPHLTYCSLVWHFCKASDQQKLERLNHRGLRAVFCDWTSPYEELLKRARMKSLYKIRLKNIAIFMFKTKYGLQPKNISDLFQQKMSKCNLRNNDFQVQRFKTVQYGKHALRYIGPALWAKLPKETRDLNTLGPLKNTLET